MDEENQNQHFSSNVPGPGHAVRIPEGESSNNNQQIYSESTETTNMQQHGTFQHERQEKLMSPPPGLESKLSADDNNTEVTKNNEAENRHITRPPPGFPPKVDDTSRTAYDGDKSLASRLFYHKQQASSTAHTDESEHRYTGNVTSDREIVHDIHDDNQHERHTKMHTIPNADSTETAGNMNDLSGMNHKSDSRPNRAPPGFEPNLDNSGKLYDADKYNFDSEEKLRLQEQDNSYKDSDVTDWVDVKADLDTERAMHLSKQDELSMIGTSDMGIDFKSTEEDMNREKALAKAKGWNTCENEPNSKDPHCESDRQIAICLSKQDDLLCLKTSDKSDLDTEKAIHVSKQDDLTKKGTSDMDFKSTEEDINKQKALAKAKGWNTSENDSNSKDSHCESDREMAIRLSKENDFPGSKTSDNAFTDKDNAWNKDKSKDREGSKDNTYGQGAKVWSTHNDNYFSSHYNWRKDEAYLEATKKYVYFWRNRDIYSQWYKSKFYDDQGQKFNCAEQFMMHRKAVLFQDEKIAKKILGEKDPRKIKALGREVKGFNEQMWAHNCLHIVKEANIAKFSQDAELMNEIISTYPKTLVEASPYDKIWGIGFAEEDCEAWDEAKWNGKNFLGYILTEVRDELMVKQGMIKEEEKSTHLERLMTTELKKYEHMSHQPTEKTSEPKRNKNEKRKDAKEKDKSSPKSKGKHGKADADKSGTESIDKDKVNRERNSDTQARQDQFGVHGTEYEHDINGKGKDKKKDKKSKKSDEPKFDRKNMEAEYYMNSDETERDTTKKEKDSDTQSRPGSSDNPQLRATGLDGLDMV